jgi:hypothetical protein
VIAQLPVKLFENPSRLVEALPHATVSGLTGANTAGAAGSTVMFLDCVTVLPQLSVNDQDSIMFPLQ